MVKGGNMKKTTRRSIIRTSKFSYVHLECDFPYVM
jgi:hypothetical protein